MPYSHSWSPICPFPMPYIVAVSDVMIAVVMLINTLILVCNIIVLRMAGKHEGRMNERLRRVIFRWLGRLFCRKCKVNPDTGSKTQSPKVEQIAPKSNDMSGDSTSNDEVHSMNMEPPVHPNPDLRILAKEDKQLSLSLARPQPSLPELSVNGSLCMQDKESFLQEWHQAARILDRFFGCSCFLLMVFMLLVVYFTRA